MLFRHFIISIFPSEDTPSASEETVEAVESNDDQSKDATVAEAENSASLAQEDGKTNTDNEEPLVDQMAEDTEKVQLDDEEGKDSLDTTPECANTEEEIVTEPKTEEVKVKWTATKIAAEWRRFNLDLSPKVKHIIHGVRVD